MVFEKCWVSAWPIIAFSLILVSIILLDILPYLPSFLHWAALCSLAGVGIWLLIRLISKNYKSNISELERRLSKENKINHRPFDFVNDKNIFQNVSQNSNLVWTEHKARVIKQINKLDLFWPISKLSALDPLLFGLL